MGLRIAYEHSEKRDLAIHVVMKYAGIKEL
jgi:hypothetical protein